ncbi:hypothetical protein M011DRAFT_479202 [Sporormia fimetaria CBS 119925]|uniref:Uncharacterized protein n=1 Tax=Sporormia fimetaria CBS 119925 TaxID=1340428 RepID=A0A6A6V8A5_9PLEO|nr:hypothetical protein M011DRAFT_479202 [Sporormia fimetaria CBS 119925]
MNLWGKKRSLPQAQKLGDDASTAQESAGRTHWYTVVFIIGPFLVGLAFAVGHFCFFQFLNGRPVDDFAIGQSFVSTISLLLITAFRLCMVGCVGLCFAQHLWYVLRRTALPIFRVEQLFSVRSNPLILGNPRLLWTAPMLFSMAVYIWFIELAAVYPPGALVVESKPFLSVQETNIPVVNAPISKIYDPWTESGTYPIFSDVVNGSLNAGESGVTFMGPLKSLTSLSKYVLAAGDIVDLPPPVAQNLSYSLQFRAPQVSCVQKIANTTIVMTRPEPAPRGEVSIGIHIDDIRFQPNVFESLWDNDHTYTLTTRRFFGYYVDAPLDYSDTNYYELVRLKDRRFFFATEETNLTCETLSVLYDVDVTYVNGRQQLGYSMSDAQPLSLGSNQFDVSNSGPTESGSAAWREKLKSGLENWSVFSLADAPLRLLNYSLALEYEARDGIAGQWRRENGSVTDIATLTEFGNTVPSPLDGSIFDSTRFQNERSEGLLQILGDEKMPIFDPRNLAINTTSINALLTNITISSLRLGVQTAPIPVTISTLRNIYSFSDRITFFLPYGLCLGFAVIYVVIGIRALLLNGVPSTDGGFLQIMVSTRGRTVMEDLVLKHGVVGTRNLPKELLEMKVRFGELMEAVEEIPMGAGSAGDGLSPRRLRPTRTVTFGTVDETVPLRRGRTDSGLSP